MTPTADSDPDRPEFMETLGLLPPYTVEDVQAAYRTLVRDAHPDTGGDARRFALLHEAYERGLEYARFRAGRRDWLAKHVGAYVEREAALAELERRGGRVRLWRCDWARREFGDDFGQVLDRVLAVECRGSSFGDEVIEFLKVEFSTFRYVTTIDLAGTRVGDRGVLELRDFSALNTLNLNGTAVSNRCVDALASFRGLRILGVGGTRMTWWGRWRLRRLAPKLWVSTRPAPDGGLALDSHSRPRQIEA